MTPIRIILAGVGTRGKYWADVLNRSPRCTTVAYVDPNPEALAFACLHFGEQATFATVEEALAAVPDVQALILSNPPMGRESQVRAATERGIPMLIEKPLALDLVEAARLVNIAEAADVPLMVGLNFRYLATTREMMALLDSGTVGQAEFTRFTYERYRDGRRPGINKYPLTMEHPMLWEQSIHHFDLLRYVYQQEPVLVHCQTWNPSWTMYDDHANVAALITFDSGMVANYQGTWQGSPALQHFEWRTDCTGGVISQREQFSELFYATNADKNLIKIELPPHEIWVTETIGLFDAFLDTVIDGQPLQCSGRDHLMSLAILEACIRSSREGTGVANASVLQDIPGTA